MGTTHDVDSITGTACAVSIIIPNWNGGSVLEECLASILEHTRGVDFELILVDNGSSDESRRTIQNLAARNDRVSAILNDDNLFFATACNQGYGISRGRFLLIANNDIVLTDDAVTRMVRYADRHPDVAAVTPMFVDRDGVPQEFVRRLPTALHVLAHYHRLGRAIDRFLLGRRLQNHYFYRDRDFTTAEMIEQAGASFTLFRRTSIESLDCLFDERYPLLFNDVDLYFRLRRAGAASHVVPSIRVVHLAGVSSARLNPAIYRRQHFDAMFTYFRQHHPWQLPLLYAAWPQWWIGRR